MDCKEIQPVHSEGDQPWDFFGRNDVKAEAGIKIAGRNMKNFRYADDTTLMAESEELKSLLMKVKEESEKVG